MAVVEEGDGGAAVKILTGVHARTWLSAPPSSCLAMVPDLAARARRPGAAAIAIIGSRERPRCPEDAATERSSARRCSSRAPAPVAKHFARCSVSGTGPFVRSRFGEEADESACLEWLDRQPEDSVVYVSFGTGGALSVEQTAELAAGLEMSGHRFLWVVRMQSLDGNPCALGTIPGEKDDPLAWLPDGFLERTSGRGLAVPAWASQVRVLSHPVTASFVSHCGWNSTLESVAAVVPMVAWPLYAEQKTNAAILTEVTGVALRPAAARGQGHGLVTREEIAAAVREVMEGEKGSAVRGRARELREASKRAWSSEGSSRRAMAEVAGKLKAALVNGNGLIAIA